MWMGVSFQNSGPYNLTLSKYEPMPEEPEWCDW